MNDDMQFEIAKLTLKPGDVLVIKSKHRLNDNGERHVLRYVKNLLAEAGHETPVLITYEGLDLEILEHAA